MNAIHRIIQLAMLHLHCTNDDKYYLSSREEVEIVLENGGKIITSGPHIGGRYVICIRFSMIDGEIWFAHVGAKKEISELAALSPIPTHSNHWP